MSVKNNKNTRSTLQLFGRVSGLGISFALIICFMAFFGYKADVYFTTLPVLTCIGIIIGFFLALISIYQIIKKDHL